MGPRVSETSAPPAPPATRARTRSTLSASTQRIERSDRDIRRKRPPVVSFLLRTSTVWRMARVASLLALDFAGVALAIFTALVLKEAVHGSVQAVHARESTEHFLPFAYLLTALLFARSGLYAQRSLRPGLSRIVGSLFEVAFVALIYAVVSGEHFSSYYLFWSSLAFAIFYIASFRAVYERVTGLLLRSAGYQRRAVLVGSGKHIVDVAHALADVPHAPIDVVGFLCPSRCRTTACARSARWRASSRCSPTGASTRSSSPTPTSRRTTPSSSSISATGAACECAWRPRRWRS